MKTIYEAAIGQLSHSTYLHHWNTLIHFGLNVLQININLPVQIGTICLFITHLYSLGLRYTTIRNYASAITFVHKISGWADPISDQRVAKLLQGVRNLQQSDSRASLPITKPLLHSLVDAIPFCTPEPYLRTLYKTIFLVCFYACLRVSEAVISANDQHTLTIGQITRTRAGFTITFRSYKHSNHSGGDLPIFCLAPSLDPYCPVSSLDKYLSIRGRTPGPIFVNQSGAPVNRQQLVQFLKACVSMCGLPVSKYSTHSFRISRATQLSFEQVPEDQIRQIGRWKSNAYLKYIRHQHLTLPGWVWISSGRVFSLLWGSSNLLAQRLLMALLWGITKQSSKDNLTKWCGIKEMLLRASAFAVPKC